MSWDSAADVWRTGGGVGGVPSEKAGPVRTWWAERGEPHEAGVQKERRFYDVLWPFWCSFGNF